MAVDDDGCTAAGRDGCGRGRRRVKMLLVWGFQKNCVAKWRDVISMGSEE